MRMFEKLRHIATDPYRGVRDFYPEDQAVHNYLLHTMRTSMERFGYEEYHASILEPAELYRAKTSEEIVSEQTYTFTDRGNREVTLRPEMTPTTARMVSARRRDLAFPLRWFSVANVFRYERPQRGRLREHWQLNADFFGLEGIHAETEIIHTASSILNTLGLKETDFSIQINNRAILRELLIEGMGISEASFSTITRILDKREKVHPQNFKAAIFDAFGKETAQAERFLSFLDTKDLHGIIATFSNHEALKEKLRDTEELIHNLSQKGVTNVNFNRGLARGFDYYTGMIFEIFDTDTKNNRSLAGGGRYDNLIKTFSGHDIPAVGFGMGDVTIAQALESRGLLPPYTSQTTLYLCIAQTGALPYAEKVAAMLRDAHINTAIDFTGKKIGDQIRYAVRHHIPYIACIGDQEVSSKKIVVKNLKEESEKTVPEDELITYLTHE